MNIFVILLILLKVIEPVWGLNILLATRNSWVSLNVRYLHKALQEAGHNAILVGTLEENGDRSTDEVGSLPKIRQDGKSSNSGDFGYLLPVHQKYYSVLKKLSEAPRGAKGVVKMRSETDETPVISNEIYGQDPLDRTAWYVNMHAVSSLIVALDIILPEHLPEFTPDLILLGPNEGISMTPLTRDGDMADSNTFNSMIELSMLRGYPTMAVSSADINHIFFKDEKYFNVQYKELDKQLSKKHSFVKNIKFINHKILNLISKLENTGSLEPGMALNINIPSINLDWSRCDASLKHLERSPDFKQVVYNSKPQNFEQIRTPLYQLVDGKIEMLLISALYGKIVAKVTAEKEEEEQSTFVDKRSKYYEHLKHMTSVDQQSEDENQELLESDSANAYMENIPEFKILSDCGISVNVLHVTEGAGLGSEVFNLTSVLKSNS